MLLLEIFKKMSLTETFVMLLMEGKLDKMAEMYSEKLEDRFDNDNRVPANMKARLSQGENIAGNLINLFAEIDPTRKKSNVQWMIIQYIKGEHLEDIDHAKRALTTLEKYKGKIAKNQIMQYKSIAELNAEIEKVIKSGDVNDLDNIPPEEATYVVNSPNFKIIIPKTHKASCKYGASGWCTTNDDDHYYKNYTGQGDLYIIMVGGGTDPKKYQLSYEGGEFNNSQNKPLTQHDIDTLSKFPQYKDFLNMLIKKHYSKYFK